MEDRIPRQLHHCHEVCCKKGGHHGRRTLIVDKKYTMEMCFSNKWTWHIIEWKVGDKVMLSMKDLVFKERLAKKLVDRYMGLYIIDEMVSTNAVKLQLLTLMRIYLVVNISQVV